MTPPERSALRRLARELDLSLAAVDAAHDLGLFDDAGSADECRATLRQMRRLMLDLDVNAPGAALLVRLRRELVVMHFELSRLQSRQDRWLENWHDGLWRELPE